MNIELNWQEQVENKQVIYVAEPNITAIADIAPTTISCIEKALSLLSENVIDESRYFLFEWNAEQSLLAIIVTDDTKKLDSKYVVKCQIQALDLDKETLLEEVKYEIKDYLTTCSAFFKFSLVAVFQGKSRDSVELL